MLNMPTFVGIYMSTYNYTHKVLPIHMSNIRKLNYFSFKFKINIKLSF